MFEFVHWNTFGVLLMAGLIGAISVIPLNRSVLDDNASRENDSVTLSAASRFEWLEQILIYAAITSAALFCGFFAIERLGVDGAPIMAMWFAGAVQQIQFSTYFAASLAGLAMGAALSPLSLYRSKDTRVDFYKIALWKRLLAGVFHGGIFEELLFRWGLLSLFAWLTTLAVGGTGNSTSDGVFWVANFISALLFGVAHLPGSATAAPLTPIIAIGVVSLNFLVGLVCGYFFWAKGIEAAIVAHMFTHIGLQPCSAVLRHLFNGEAGKDH